MKITVVGTGYVGLVSGACFAEVGIDVTCVDIDVTKIENLKKGIIPIYEPGLADMVQRNRAAERLLFTTDAKKGVGFGEIQFIAVGTPPDEDGSADLQYVLAVAESIAENMDDFKIVVDKSTVPVGTGDKVAERIRETLPPGVEIAIARDYAVYIEAQVRSVFEDMLIATGRRVTNASRPRTR